MSKSCYHYIGLLAQGGAEPGSIERQDYIRLRASLEGLNWGARLYEKWLTVFLNGVERFFGDAGTEGQRAFGLHKPAPLWNGAGLRPLPASCSHLPHRYGFCHLGHLRWGQTIE